MDPLAAVKYFIGRFDRYTQQNKDGSYSAIKKPLSNDVIKNHVKGRTTIGSYTNTDQGRTPVAMLDVDGKSDLATELVNFVYVWLNHFEIPSFIEPSGSKGYHVWVVFKSFQLAKKAQRLMQIAVDQFLEERMYAYEDLGFGVEVFPKQREACNFDSPGSAVKIPWGIHQVTGARTSILNGHMDTLKDWGISLILKSPMIHESTIDAVLEQYPEPESKEPETGSKSKKYALPCYAKMLEGVAEGFRHIAVFRLAIHMYRQGITDSTAINMLRLWNDSNKPPLHEKEIQTAVKSAYTGKYKLGCSDIEAAGFCDKSCPIRNSRYLERDNMVENKLDTIIDEIIKIDTNPPYFKVSVIGTIIPMNTDELYSVTRFKKKCMESIQIIPHIGLKQVEWEMVLNQKITVAGIEEAPEDATESGEMLDLIYDWFSLESKGTTVDDLRAGKPIVVENYYCFRVRDLVMYLRNKHRLFLKNSQLWPIIKGAGGDHAPVRIGPTVFRLWKLPVEDQPREKNKSLEDIDF